MAEQARGVVWDREVLPDGRYKYVVALVLVTDAPTLSGVVCAPQQGVAGQSRLNPIGEALSGVLERYDLCGRFQDASDALTADWQWEGAQKVRRG